MHLKRTKIVCTIGPSSWDYHTLRNLAEAGMDVARLNFSHGTYEEKKAQIDLIRKISIELKKPLTIIADMQGPKLRLGSIDGIREIRKGDEVILSPNPKYDELPIQYDFTSSIKSAQRVYLNDGLIELKVLSVEGKKIIAKAENSGIVSSNKGINIPDTKLKEEVFTTKDSNDAQFAISAGVDYLALSFIQTSEDLKKPIELLKKNNSATKILVKIEKKEAVENLEEIIKLSDAVMVARGDLALETAASEVPIIQQKIIKLSRQYHKPVIVATQMLESMIENPRPTRAEVSDVANAVLDQVDAVMLSAETASGKYPVEAVKTMNNVIVSVEEHPDYKHYIKFNWENISGEELSFSAIVSAAASLAYRIDAKFIAVATTSGRIATLLASFRPNSNIIAVTHEQKICTQLSLVWGTTPLVIEPEKDIEHFISDIISHIKKNSFVKVGDKVIVVVGTKIGISGLTDSIRVITV